MSNATYFLNHSQYDFLANLLPLPPRKAGRPSTPNGELLPGVIYVLRTGCRWSDIPTSICHHHYSSCWRRLNFWRKHGYLKLGWQRILVLLDHEGQIDLSLGNLDGTLVQAPKYSGVGYDSQHHRYGTNISLLTERNGLPLTGTTFKGNRNDIVAAEPTMRKLRVGAKRRVLELNADKGYDSKRSVGTCVNVVPAPISLSEKLNTGESGDASRTWTKLVSSSVHSWNRPTPGSKATTGYVTGTNASVGCFRP